MPALARPAPAPVRPRIALPEPVLGRYALVEQLAAGPWCDVFRARAVADRSHDAANYVVKAVRCEGDDRAFARALLQREAMVAASVSDPHLVPLLDADLSGNRAYVVFPFLDGQTLTAQLTAARISVPQALWYLRQIAGGLAALHEAGWLHGDMKPSNVMLSPEGHVTLIDLGLARRLGSAECQSSEWLAGNLDFAAPEVLLPGRTVTGAADIFAAGLLLFAMLAGQSQSASSIRADQHAAIASLRAKRPDLSREVALLLLNMTASEPLRRPAARELVERLTRLEIESLMQW